MYGSLSREVADLRAKDLRLAGGARRRPRGARGWRHRLGPRLTAAGTRLAGTPARSGTGRDADPATGERRIAAPVGSGVGPGLLAAVALPSLGWIVVLALVLALVGFAAWVWGADSREPGGRDPFGRDRSRG